MHSDYIKRISNVFEFIDENLDSTLKLETVAKIANYSPFHFHRLFKLITNETLNSYVNRRRIEKAAGILMRKNEVNIQELSLRYGFSSNSSFTRAFKNYYGLSPTDFKNQNPGKYSKIRKVNSKIRQDDPLFEEYICNITNLKNWIDMNAKIEVKETTEWPIAYITCIGVHEIGNTYEKLIRWATPKGLLNDPETKMINVYHDSFKITAPDKVRINACVSIKDDIKADGEVKISKIDGGRHIIGSFEIGLQEFEKSWTGLFMWMNENGYEKADRKPFAVYHNDYRTHPEKKCIVDLYIPVI